MDKGKGDLHFLLYRRGRIFMQIGLPVLEILEMITDMSVSVLKAKCCGLDGLYGFSKENFDLSMRIGRELFEVTKNHEQT